MFERFSKKAVLFVLLVLVVALSGVTTLSAAPPWKKVDVPFTFKAGDARLEDGSYRILERDNDGAPVLVLQGKGGKVTVPIVTRLARTASSSAVAKFVFDSVDGEHILSEVWLPGEDGFLVRGNAGERMHEHEVVDGE